MRSSPALGEYSPSGPPGQDSGDDSSPLFQTDDFRIWCMKVIPCTKRFVHDWTVCPFAHAGEKAVRRDPRLVNYTGIACPDMKKTGNCIRGDRCPYAHNVFEYWLHPTRYRTQLCNDGPTCRRSICFFAHSLDQLRVPACKPYVSPEALARASLEAIQQNPHPLAQQLPNPVAAQQQAVAQQQAAMAALNLRGRGPPGGPPPPAQHGYPPPQQQHGYPPQQHGYGLPGSPHAGGSALAPGAAPFVPGGANGGGGRAVAAPPHVAMRGFDAMQMQGYPAPPPGGDPRHGSGGYAEAAAALQQQYSEGHLAAAPGGGLPSFRSAPATRYPSGHDAGGYHAGAGRVSLPEYAPTSPEQAYDSAASLPAQLSGHLAHAAQQGGAALRSPRGSGGGEPTPPEAGGAGASPPGSQREGGSRPTSDAGSQPRSGKASPDVSLSTDGLAQTLASLKIAMTQQQLAAAAGSNHEVVISTLHQILKEAAAQQAPGAPGGAGASPPPSPAAGLAGAHAARAPYFMQDALAGAPGAPGAPGAGGAPPPAGRPAPPPPGGGYEAAAARAGGPPPGAASPFKPGGLGLDASPDAVAAFHAASAAAAAGYFGGGAAAAASEAPSELAEGSDSQQFMARLSSQGLSVGGLSASSGSSAAPPAPHAAAPPPGMARPLSTGQLGSLGGALATAIDE
eukprot:scaffold4.g4925.t1